MNILISGASGNVGKAVAHYAANQPDMVIRKASTKPVAADEFLFDFGNVVASKDALRDVDIFFLMRPPQLSDTDKYFAPIINACVELNVKHIIFLSVQGADKSSIIPHNKIEKLVRESGLHYTFIRPSYFMQNLTTTLKEDIVKHDSIVLPAGKEKFLWIDVNDIGKAVAQIMSAPETHINKTYTITSNDLCTFGEVAEMLSKKLHRTIRYRSPNLLSFFFYKRKQGMKPAFIVVMIVLHYIARFEDEPMVTNDFKMLTGLEPTPIEKFIDANRNQWASA